MKKWGWMVIGCIGMVAVAYFTSSSSLEIVATITGLLSVWLTAREIIWAWPVGLVNVACFFYMFLDVKLYADMTLQVFFFILSVYGWIVWLTSRGHAKVRPTRLISRNMTIGLAVIFLLATIAWGYVLARFTDASIPYADACIATLSVIAQYLLSYKVLENWLVWITVDVLSIGMYLFKGLDLVAILYVVFLGIAIAGYFSWRKEYRIQQSIGSADIPKTDLPMEG